MIAILIILLFCLSIYWSVLYCLYLDFKLDEEPYLDYKGNDYYSDYFDPVKNFPHFTFAQFIKFYNLNPDSWCFANDENHILGAPAKKEGNRFYPIFFTNFFEYRKYICWAKKNIKKLNKANTQKAQDEATKHIVSLVQKDIDTIRVENAKVLYDTERVISESLKNLQVEKRYTIKQGDYINNYKIYSGVQNDGRKVESCVNHCTD